MSAEQIEIPLGPLVFDARVDGPVEGEPVLLLHGFPESGWSWRHVQPALANAGFRSVAPDLRGYSPRARPTDPDAYRVETLVADVTGLADALGWSTVHLVGHDWGGVLAWHVAGRHPERLRTLSVASTPHPDAFHRAKKAGPSAEGDDQAAKSSYIDLFRTPGSEHTILADDGALFRQTLEGSGLDPESAAPYIERFADPDALVGALNWYRGADPTDAAGMGPITTPTLYVWSTDDVALGRTAAELTADHVEGPYRFEILDGVSHWIPETAPDAFAAHLLAHLQAPH
jgi:pimeloyl-ACP methyl ester carboxylesterase